MEKAVSFEPDNKAILLKFAALLVNNKRTDEAITALTRHIAYHPSEHQARRMLGDVYLKEGLIEQAWGELLPCTEHAMEAEQWTEAHELLAPFRASHPVPVKERLLTICKAQGDEETTRNELRELAGLHEDAQTFEKALQVYKELLQLSPDDRSSAQKIRELEITLGIAEPVEEGPAAHVSPPANETLPPGEAIPENPVPENIHAEIPRQEPLLQHTHHDTTDAPPLQERPAAEPAQQPEIIRYEEVLSAPAGPVPDNITDVPDSAASSPVGNLTERKAEADFYAAQGLNEEALAIYKELLSFDPDNEEINSKINSLNQPSSATAEPAASKEIVAPDIQEELSVPPSVDDDLKNIFAAFGKSEEPDVEDYESRYQTGIEFRQQGRLDDAIKELQVAVLDPDKIVRNSTMLAMCYMEKGSYSLAIVGFNKVLESMSSSDATYIHVKYELANAYLKNRENEKSLELFSEIHAEKSDFKDVAHKVHSLKPPPLSENPKPKKDRISYI